MNRWFADTFYYLAMLNTRDQHHGKVRRFHQAFVGHITTTEAVLLELLNTLSETPLRSKAAQFMRIERVAGNVEIKRLSGSLLDRGLKLYEDRPDKQWSLTDCISFLVMEDEGLTDALTGDHHFEQAGFRAVFA